MLLLSCGIWAGKKADKALMAKIAQESLERRKLLMDAVERGATIMTDDSGEFWMMQPVFASK